MSYLLRIQQDKNRRAKLQSAPRRPQIQTFRSTQKVAPKLGGYGGQIQVRRPPQLQQRPPQLQQRQTQQRQMQQLPLVQRPVQQQYQQQQQRQPQVKEQDAQTLAEVAHDLSVLRLQQHQAQQKLQKVKKDKQYKIELLSDKEKKLHSLKYANGERDAQIQRARDVLSICTQGLSSIKLHSNRASHNLKAFDDKTKKGRKAVIALHADRRSTNHVLLALRNSLEDLQKKKVVAQSKVDQASEILSEAKRSVESYRTEINGQNAKTKELVESLAATRSGSASLQDELDQATKSEAEAKSRIDRIHEAIGSDTKLQQECARTADVRLKELREQTDVMVTESESIVAAVANKKKKMTELHHCCVELQRAEEHPESPPMQGAGPLPLLDISRLKETIERRRLLLEKMQATFDQNMESLHKLTDESKRLDSDIERAIDETATILPGVDAMLKEEAERENKVTEFYSTLDAERKSVDSLRESVADLEAKRRQQKKDCTAQLADQADALKARKEKLQDTEKAVAEHAEKLAEEVALVKREEVYHATKLREAKEEADAVKTEFEQLQQEVEAQKVDGEKSLNEKLDELKMTSKMMTEESESKVKELLRKYPVLRSLEVPQSSDDPREELEAKLLDLKKACQGRVAAARRKYYVLKEEEKRQLVARKKAARDKKDRERQKREVTKKEERPSSKPRSVLKRQNSDGKTKRSSDFSSSIKAKEEKRDSCDVRAVLKRGDTNQRSQSHHLEEHLDKKPDLDALDILSVNDDESDNDDEMVGVLTQQDGPSLTQATKESQRTQSSQKVRFLGISSQETLTQGSRSVSSRKNAKDVSGDRSLKPASSNDDRAVAKTKNRSMSTSKCQQKPSEHNSSPSSTTKAKPTSGDSSSKKRLSSSSSGTGKSIVKRSRHSGAHEVKTSSRQAREDPRRSTKSSKTPDGRQGRSSSISSKRAKHPYEHRGRSSSSSERDRKERPSSSSSKRTKHSQDDRNVRSSSTSSKRSDRNKDDRKSPASRREDDSKHKTSKVVRSARKSSGTSKSISGVSKKRSRDVESASQASGIPSDEKKPKAATKSRRRSKSRSSGASVSSNKTRTSQGGGADFGFSF